MKAIVISLFSFSVFSCGPGNYENQEKTTKEDHYVFQGQEQYEQVTHIAFPNDFKVISNPKMREGDFIRKTVIELNRSDQPKFLEHNDFHPLPEYSPVTISSLFFDSIYRSIPERNNFLHKFGKQTGVKWACFLDTTKCRLYCLISYPGYNGYAK